MHLDADARLAAAAGGAVKYFADAAGLDHDAIAHLQAAVISACEEAFEDLAEDRACVDVTLTWRVDRIEIAVSHKTASAATAQSGLQGEAARDLEGVDEVRHETRDHLAVTRLTKFLRQGAAKR